jgi:hypothetical protein
VRPSALVDVSPLFRSPAPASATTEGAEDPTRPPQLLLLIVSDSRVLLVAGTYTLGLQMQALGGRED